MSGIEEDVPFPGLRAFTRDESYLFFGRDSQVTELIDKLADSRFLAVLGSSGSGKSSLVRTGLLEYLELGLHPAGSDWMVIDFHPAGDPIGALAAGLFEAQGMEVKGEEFELLAHSLRRGPRAIIEWCEAGHLPEGRNLLLMADQFEELFRFSSYAEREEAEAFARLLIESSNCPDFPISVCLTMRTEFLADCAMIPGLAERINDGLYLTPRMNRDECEEAIVGPAGVSGFEVEPKLANQLLNDMATLAPWEDKNDVSQTMASRADQLPLMQHVLNQLYLETSERDGPDNVVLTRDHYREIGRLTGALDVHGLQVLEDLGAAPPASDVVPAKGQPANDTRAPGTVDHELVSQVFRALVAGPSLSKAVRRPCRFDELVRATGDEVAARAVVDAFRAHGVNFLRPYEGVPLTDDTVIDISHESLIRQWNLLTGWFDEEREAGVAWQQLQTQQEAYAEGRSDLLSGLALANLSQFWENERPTAAWAERHGGDFASIEAFYLTSKETDERQRAEAEAEQRRKTNRLRVWLAGTAALAFVALGGAWYGFTQAAEARNSAETAIAATEDQKRATQAQAEAAQRAGLAETRAEAEALAALEAAKRAEASALAQEEAANRATLSEQQARSNLAEAQAAERVAEAARRQAEEQADANVDLIRRIGEAITVGGGTEEVTGDELRKEVRDRLPDQSRNYAAEKVPLEVRYGSASALPLALATTLPLVSKAATASGAPQARQSAGQSVGQSRDRPCRTEWQLIADLEPDRQMSSLPGSLQTQCLARELAQFFDAQLSRSGIGPERGRTANLGEILQINTMLGKAWFTARNWKESIGAYERAHDAGRSLLVNGGRERLLDDTKLRDAYFEASYNWLSNAREVRQSGKAEQVLSEVEEIAALFDLEQVKASNDIALATNLARIEVLRMAVYRDFRPDEDKKLDAELRLSELALILLDMADFDDFEGEDLINSTLEGLGVVAFALGQIEDGATAAENAELTCDISDLMRIFASDSLDRRVTRASLHCATTGLNALDEEETLAYDHEGRLAAALDAANRSLDIDPFDERTRLALIDTNMASAKRLQSKAALNAIQLRDMLGQEAEAVRQEYLALEKAEIDKLPPPVGGGTNGPRTAEETPRMQELRGILSDYYYRLDNQLGALAVPVTSGIDTSAEPWLYCDASLVNSILDDESGGLGLSEEPEQSASESAISIWDEPEPQPAATKEGLARDLRQYSAQCLARINQSRSDFQRVLAQSGGKALQRWNPGLFVDIGWSEWAETRGQTGDPASIRQNFVETALEVGLVTLRDLPGSFQTLDTIYQIVKREESNNSEAPTFEQQAQAPLIDDKHALEVSNAALTHILQGDGTPTFWDRHVVNLGCRMHGERLDLLESPDLGTLVSAAQQLRAYCQDVSDNRVWAAYTRNALQGAYYKLTEKRTGDAEWLSTAEGYKALSPFLEWASMTGHSDSTKALLRQGGDRLTSSQRDTLQARTKHQEEVFGFEYETDYGNTNTWFFRHSDDPLWGGEAFLSAMDTYGRGIGPEPARTFLENVSRLAAQRGVPMPVLARSVLLEAQSYHTGDAGLDERYSRANDLLALGQGHVPVNARGIALQGYSPQSVRDGTLQRPAVPMYAFASGGLYAFEDDSSSYWENWPAFNGFDPVALAAGRLIAGAPQIVGEITPDGGGMTSTYALFATRASLQRWQADPARIMLAAADQWITLKPASLRHLADRERVWARAEQVTGSRENAVASARAAMVEAGRLAPGVAVAQLTLAADAMLPAPGRTPTDADGIAFGGIPLEDVAPDFFRGGDAEDVILFRGARIALTDRGSAGDVPTHWPLFNGWDPVELAKGQFVSGSPELANDPSSGDDLRPYALFANETNRAQWERGDGSLYVAAREAWLTERADYAGDLPANDAEIVATAQFTQAVGQLLPPGVNATLALSQSVAENATYMEHFAEAVESDDGPASYADALAKTLVFDGKQTPIDAQGFAFGGNSVWALESGDIEPGDQTLPLFFRGALVATRGDEGLFNIRGSWPLFNGWDPVELAKGRLTAGLLPINILHEKYGFERPVLFSNEANRDAWARAIVPVTIAATETMRDTNVGKFTDTRDDIFDLWEIATSERLAAMIPELDEGERAELSYETVWELRDSEAFANVSDDFEKGRFHALASLVDLSTERLAIVGRRTPVGDNRVAFAGMELASILTGEAVAGDTDGLKYYRGALYAGRGVDASEVQEYWPGFNGWDPVALSEGRFEAGSTDHVYVDPELPGPLLFASAERLAQFQEQSHQIQGAAIDQWGQQLPEFKKDVEEFFGFDFSGGH